MPSIFVNTGWVGRKLTPQEILSVLDTPCAIFKAVDQNAFLIKDSKFAEVIPIVVPLKSLQEISRDLFRFEKSVERSHIIPIYNVMRLGPEVAVTPTIYDEIDQAKIAKNDEHYL